MKTEEKIKERINKLKVRLNITAKHHDKYVDLYTRAKHSWKDVFSSRIYKYHSKYTELYSIWKEMTYYKKALEWVLEDTDER